MAEGAPRGLTTIHPIAAGDMFGTKGVDHIAHKGMIARIIGGSYPSGPTNAEPPLIWQRILAEDLAAWNVPSGIVFDMLREGAAQRPGVLTKVGMETFVDPDQDGCAMNASARKAPLVRRVAGIGEVIECAQRRWRKRCRATLISSPASSPACSIRDRKSVV